MCCMYAKTKKKLTFFQSSDESIEGRQPLSYTETTPKGMNVDERGIEVGRGFVFFFESFLWDVHERAGCLV